jgi:hypothetical protein
MELGGSRRFEMDWYLLGTGAGSGRCPIEDRPKRNATPATTPPIETHAIVSAMH